MTEDILESRAIDAIVRSFQQAPHRIHGVHQADAELIDLGLGYDRYLALTTDALLEEVHSGLYEDPYLVGWMLAMVNFSDLAAVGADPLGLLVSISYPPRKGGEFISKMTRGISEACQKVNSFVLGGDTNRTERLSLSGCAAGLVPKESAMTRMGVRPQDKVYLTGPAGAGGLFALGRFLPGEILPTGFSYKPVARIKEGKIIREFARSCMDTSDGVIHTLDTLMRLNHCRIILYDDWNRSLDPGVLEAGRLREIPPWLFLASVHGEFELCFCVGIEGEQNLVNALSDANCQAVPVGEVEEGKGVVVRTGSGDVPLDTTFIRNLSESAGVDQKGYIGELLKMGKALGI